MPVHLQETMQLLTQQTIVCVVCRVFVVTE